VVREGASMAAKKKEDATSMAARQREIAVSEFFAKNRHLLGFDNPTKALLTTVREAVDNALDACEEAHILPDIEVKCEDLGNNRYRLTVTDNGPGILKNQLDKIFGQLLYGSKFHRLKQSRGQQGIGISAATMYGQMTTGKAAVVTSKTGKGRPVNRIHLQIDTKKNRAKRVKEEVIENDPVWNERVSGTSIAITLEGNYKGGKHSIDAYLRQTALANGHAFIRFVDPKGVAFDYPRVVNELPVEAKEIKPHPHGIELGTLMAMLQDARGQTVSNFLQNSFSRVTQQVTTEILTEAKVSGRSSATSTPPADIEKLYKAIQNTKIMSPPTNCLSPIGEEALAKGLYWLFVEARKEREAAKAAERAEASGDKDSGQLDLLAGDAADAAKASAEAKKDTGDSDEEKNTAEELAAVKLNEDGAIESEEEEYFVTAVTRPPSVYRGNPFQIEVGLFYGKGLPADELARVYRFANRVPLQYQASACAMSKAVNSVPWRNYEVQQSRGAPPTGPMVIMVHIASGWVPYTSESKEAIASYDEITKELRLAIMECGRRLQRFLRKRKREADEAKKRSYITKYLDPIGEALQDILGLSEKQKQETLDELKEILEKSRPSAGKKKAKKKAKTKDAEGEQPAA
jgi:DNA topoisomerase-6 subunit B